jgi:hypothetical protein
MSDKKDKSKRTQVGAQVDSELYKKLQIEAVKAGMRPGKMLDKAIKFFLDNQRKWPDDNDNEEGIKDAD